MFKTTVDEFGKVDILVNNAGIAVMAPILETTDDVWDRTLNTNLKWGVVVGHERTRFAVL